MLLQTSNRMIGNALILDCKGKIIFGDETAFLRSHVKDLLTEYHYLVLNLADVSYIDSGGLGTLVAMYTFAQHSGSHIALAGLTGKLRDVLQITKLVTVFEVFATVEEAATIFNTECASAANMPA